MTRRMIPGQMDVAPGDIEINVGRRTCVLQVSNTGDRPVQVGSHYHFFETNEALAFDRTQARGKELFDTIGTGMRLGETRQHGGKQQGHFLHHSLLR